MSNIHRVVPTEVVQSPVGTLTYLGGVSPGGSYVLRMEVHQDRELAFGRYRKGALIPVLAGSYAYIGSALNCAAKAPAPTLARRLIRHASRCGEQRPHPIRELMLSDFRRCGVSLGHDLTPGAKRPKWHIDYLLDLPETALVGAYVIRCPTRIEAKLGQSILQDSEAIAFAPGLGASDCQGNTHILRIEAENGWWEELPGKLADLLLETSMTGFARDPEDWEELESSTQRATPLEVSLQ